MNKLPITCPIVLLLILLNSTCNREPPRSNTASKAQAGRLSITDAWARPAAKGTNSAAYLTIYNHTSGPDTLKALSAKAAAITEVHESYEKDGMAGMRPTDQLTIEQGDGLEFRPGGLHVMLMQVERQLLPGDTLHLRLKFTEAGTRKVTVVIR